MKVSRKGFTKWSACLTASIKHECQELVRKADDREEIKKLIVERRLHCPACPTRSFKVGVGSGNHVRLYKNHCKKQHVDMTHGTSSTKTCRLIFGINQSQNIQTATHRIVQLDGQPSAQGDQPNLLQKAASLLRAQLASSPSWPQAGDRLSKLCGKHLDEETVLLLDMEDTRYILSTDVALYHRVSKQYVCTDRFLWHFLGALLHPSTKAACSRVLSRLKEQCGWKGCLLPTDHRGVFKSLCEALYNHIQIKGMMEKCRGALDMRLLFIDGQYSAFLSILFQTKHGSRGHGDHNPYAPDLHVALNVKCIDGLINVHPAPNEKAEHQIAAINEGIGEGRKETVLAICGDNPPELDKPDTFREYPNLECIIKDPLHIALKAEQAFNEKTVDMTALIRRCVIKFKHGYDDGLSYFKKETGGVGPSTLPAVKAAMSARTAERLVTTIKNNAYPERPYTSTNDFVRDLAAITIMYPAKAIRKIPKSKGTTVLGSLIYATKLENLGYLFNHSRFIARHPDIGDFYGTSSVEAFQLQFKSWFRNIFHQSGRNAVLVCKACTLAQLLIANLKKTMPDNRLREHDLLTRVVQSLVESTVPFEPAFSNRVRLNPTVNESLLPPSAKRLRKRPAGQ